MAVKPPAPKHTCEDLGNELVISIPSRKNWFFIIYTGIFLVFWVFVEFLILGMFIVAKDKSFTIVMIIFLTVTTAWLIYLFAWQIAGKEVMEVSTRSITLRRVVLGIGSPKEYSAGYIKDLHVSSSNSNLNNFARVRFVYSPWRHHDTGSLAFDYGAQTFRFGNDIDEAEAKQILAETTEVSTV